MTSLSYCAIIPVYNHEQVLPAVVKATLDHLPVFMVDDGSDESCRNVMRQLTREYDRVILVTREENGGKGAAVKAGIRAALSAGYTHALQIDADGQHDPNDIPRFITHSQSQPSALIAGQPLYDGSVPKGRLYGRYATHIWVWINTLSLTIKDSMCGFRIYPLRQSSELLNLYRMGDRMDFDTEFIVRWHWDNKDIVQIPTPVTYPPNGISHFLPWRDNKLVSQMHAKLFFGMLVRLPKLIMRKLSP